MLQDLDGVTLLVDFPEDDVYAGQTGTVVAVHGDPAVAYDVEFVNAEGETIAIIVVNYSQVSKRL
jgi:hypothetical protein